MTKLSDSTIKIKLGDKEFDMHVTLEAVLAVTGAGYVEEKEAGKPYIMNGHTVYLRKLILSDFATILQLLHFGLVEQFTDNELFAMCQSSEGGITGVANQLAAYLELISFGGKKPQSEDNKKKLPVKA